MKKTLPIIVITGVTASGKTELSVELACKLGAEIICADSRIVYKGLDIVSAKPALEERMGVLHHLIDIKYPNEGKFSAGDFCKSAKKIIENAKCPIIIQGGTWFYIKSLLDNKELHEFGENKALREELNKKTNDELYQILLEKDEARANSIHKNNRDKIIRSLELIEALGGKLSEAVRPENKKLNAVWFMKNLERETLYERINKRVDKMLDLGLYKEWRQNFEKYGKIDILYDTIGYREFFDLEDNLYKNFDEATDKIKQHTRNFAKRQMTWFRQNAENFDIKNVSTLEDVMVYLKSIERGI